MRFTDIDVNFDLRYEGHQNCPKILSMNILRVFSDHHLWHQNWHQYLWTSLCQFNFFVNLLHSLGVWFFDIWLFFWQHDIFLTTWYLFDILGANRPWAPLPMYPIPLYPIAHVSHCPHGPYPLYPIPLCLYCPCAPYPCKQYPQWASLPICPIPPVPHCPCDPLPMWPIPLVPLYPIPPVPPCPYPCTHCPYPLYPIPLCPYCPCAPYPLFPHCP